MSTLPATPVVGVAFESGFGSRVHRLQHVRTGAGAVARVEGLVTEFLHGRGRDHERAERGAEHLGYGHGTVEMKHKSGGVNGLDRLGGGKQPSTHALDAAFKRELRSGRVEDGAVLELDSFAQVEGPGEAVRRHIPAACQPGGGLPGRFVVARERLVDVDVGIGVVELAVRIGGYLHRVGDAVDDDARLTPGGRGSRAGFVLAARDKPKREREHHRDHCHQGDVAPWSDEPPFVV